MSVQENVAIIPSQGDAEKFTRAPSYANLGQISLETFNKDIGKYRSWKVVFDMFVDKAPVSNC